MRKLGLDRASTTAGCALLAFVMLIAGGAAFAASAATAPKATAVPGVPAPQAVVAPAVPAPRAIVAPGQTVTAVRVERMRPQREKFATLRFLKQNRDFLRSRFDRLEEKPAGRAGAAGAIDPRFLAYQRMLAEASGAQDSAAVAEEARKRRELFGSVTELGELETQLDLLDRLLADQRTRLAALQEDFAGRQQTALSIVVSGYPGSAPVSTVGIKLEDGAQIEIPISDSQRESLRRGGVLQIFHGLIEPREQVIEVSIGGAPGDTGAAPGFITLDPSRDRLTFLRLDLSPVRATEGASSLLANTWVLDAELHASHDSEPGP